MRATNLRSVNERGFSLIEVMVSLLLLAGVMVGVSSLFIFGGKEVKSGKEMTEAYALAHDVLEEVDRMTYTQAYSYFAPTAVNLTTATDYSITTTGGGGTLSLAAAATRDGYQADIATALHNGFATLTFEGLDNTGAAAAFSLCISVRVTVRMEWDESTNHRYLHVSSVRF